jgi:peptidoglycan-N-acetylglucosamine deacetylase
VSLHNGFVVLEDALLRRALTFALLTLFALALLVDIALPAATRAQEQKPPTRKIAITFDDLPAIGANYMTAPEITDMTTRLVAVLQQQKIPVVAFVNERQLYRWGEVDQRIKALQTWLDAGFELGNHTYSHTSLNSAGLKTWEEDVILGEPVLRLLLAQHKMTLRYYRPPYLDMGRDLDTRREAEAFLSSRGYRVAPITLDAWDWMFAGVYDQAIKRNDTALEQKLADAYLSFSDAVFTYDEKYSMQLLGYEPRQIILLHASRLEADHFADLAALLRKHGYEFVTLGDALNDPAYSFPDTYVGVGTGWLDHWAISQNKRPLPGAPDFPSWVLALARSFPPLPQP